jgi:predicted secreted protein
MSKASGSRVKILIDGVAITNLHNVSMNVNGAMIDVTTKDSNAWKEVIPGLKDVTMSGDGIVDWAATLPPSTIFTKISAGTSCAVIFYDGLAGEKSYTATGYFTKYDLKAVTEDNRTFSFSIQITGSATQTATT